VAASVAGLFLLPLLMMVSGSLRPTGVPPASGVDLLPSDPTLEAYRRLPELVPLWEWLLNSTVVVAFAVPITVLVASRADDGLPAADGQRSTGTASRLVSRTWSEHWNDEGERGESVGDSFTFSEKLFHRGERVGRVAGRCEVTRVRQNAFGMNCVVTVTFRNKGDLTVQGAITYKRGQRNAPELATGGTGDYKGASGVVRLSDSPGRAVALALPTERLTLTRSRRLISPAAPHAPGTR
jgi:hypothetical protein